MPKLPEFVCTNCASVWQRSVDGKFQVLVSPGPKMLGQWPWGYKAPLTGDLPICCGGNTVEK